MGYYTLFSGKMESNGMQNATDVQRQHIQMFIPIFSV